MGMQGGLMMMTPARPPFLPKKRRNALPINVVVSAFSVEGTQEGDVYLEFQSLVVKSMMCQYYR